MINSNDVATPKELLIALEKARVDKHNPGKHDQSAHGRKGGGMGGALRGAAGAVGGAVSGAVQAVKEQGVGGAVAGAAEQGKMLAGHKAEEVLAKGQKTLDKGRRNVKAFFKSEDFKTAAWVGGGIKAALQLPNHMLAGAAKLAMKVSAGLAKLVMWDLNPCAMGLRAIAGAAKAGWGLTKLVHRAVNKADVSEEAPEAEAPTLNQYIDDSKKDFRPLLEVAMANDIIMQKAPGVPDDQKKQSADTVAKIKEQFLKAGIMSQEEINSLEQTATAKPAAA